MNAVFRLRSLHSITPLLLAALFALLLPSRTPGDPLDHWTFLQPDLTLEGQRAGVFLGPTKVIVGDHGLIAYSSDTISWTRAETRIHNHLYSVTYGADRYVAVGDFGSILTSQDGIHWSQAFNLSLNTLREVAYGAGQFVAVGDNAQILVSNDGLHWTSALSGSVDLKSVCYGLNQFIAVGDEGTMLSSPDGNFWSREFSPTSRNFTKVRFSNGMILASASFARARDGLPAAEFHTTQNLIEWRSFEAPLSIVTDVNYAASHWMAVGFRDGEKLLVASEDLKLWFYSFGVGGTYIIEDKSSVAYLLARPISLFKLATPSNVNGWVENTKSNISSLPGSLRTPLIFKGQLIVPTDYAYYYSFKDAETWKTRAISNDHDSFFGTMVHNGDILVAFANNSNNGTNETWTSLDAETWTLSSHSMPQPNLPVEKAFYDGQSWICFRRNGQEVFKSADLTNWFRIEIPIEANGYIFDISIHKSSWFITGSVYYGPEDYRGFLLTSLNGTGWSKITFTNSNPSIVLAANGIFYCALSTSSGNMRLIKSQDGFAWNETILEPPTYFPSIVLDDSQFIALDFDGSVFSSPDFEHWTLRQSFRRSTQLSGKDLSRYTFDVSQMAYAFNCVFLFDSSGSTIVRSDPLTSPSALLPSLELDRSGVLTLTGSPGNTYEIQSAATLAHPVPWVSITNMTLTSDLHSFTPSTPPPGTARFYRALLK